MTDSAGLVGRSLARSWRRQPLRAWASVGSTIIGIIIVCAIAGVSSSVLAAVRSGSAIPAVRADLIAGARAPGGMSPELAAGLRQIAGTPSSTEIVVAGSSLAGDHKAVLAIIGAPADAGRFIPAFDPAQIRQVPPRPGTTGIFLGARWASDHGLSLGSVVKLASPNGVNSWTVVGLASGSLPNGGAIGVGPIDAVRSVFGRQPGVADFVLVKVPPGERVSTLQARLRDAAPGAVTLGSASTILAPEEASFAVIRQLLMLVGLIGFLTAGAVVFVCWRFVLEDERPNLARFRLVGATRRDLILGSGAVFLSGTAVSVAIGVPLGLLAGRAMISFSRDLVGLTGLAAVPQGSGIVVPALIAAVAGVAMSGLAWGVTLRSFTRVAPIEAIQAARATRSKPIPILQFLAAGITLAIVAEVATHVLPPRLAGGALVFTAAAAITFALILPSIAGRLLFKSGGFLRLSVGRELSGNARRTAGMVSVFAVAMILSISLSGVASSLGSGLSTSVNAWTKGDMYVLPTQPGNALRDDRFSPDVAERVAAIPGVDHVSGFSQLPMKYRGKNVQMYAWQTQQVDDLVQLSVAKGARGPDLWNALRGGQVAVSANFGYLYNVKVGDRITVPTVNGETMLSVVSLVNDITGDSGIVFMSSDTYTRLTGDNRILNILVRLRPGASIPAVSAQVRAQLRDYPNLVVWNKAKIRSYLQGLLGQILMVLRLVALVCFVLALLVGAATTAAALSARRVAISLARLCGATTRLLKGQLAVESILVGLLAWIVALPLGVLSIRIMLDTIGSQSGLFPPVQVPLLLAVLTLPVAVAAATAAIWVPGRRIVASSITSNLGEG